MHDLNLQVVAEGLGFPEGPVASSDGGILAVNIQGGSLKRIVEEVVTVVAHLGGRRNGVALGPY